MVHRVKCTSTTRREGPVKNISLYCFCFLILGVTGRAKKGKKAAGIILCLAEPSNGFDLSAQIKCQMRACLCVSLSRAHIRMGVVFTSPFCICVCAFAWYTYSLFDECYCDALSLSCRVTVAQHLDQEIYLCNCALAHRATQQGCWAAVGSEDFLVNVFLKCHLRMCRWIKY
jgi:hypothetical protein